MIRVNDRFDVEWIDGITVEAILEECGFTYPLVVVSVGGEVVPREWYPTFAVPDGSDVRVLHLVAGG